VIPHLDEIPSNFVFYLQEKAEKLLKRLRCCATLTGDVIGRKFHIIPHIGFHGSPNQPANTQRHFNLSVCTAQPAVTLSVITSKFPTGIAAANRIAKTIAVGIVGHTVGICWPLGVIQKPERRTRAGAISQHDVSDRSQQHLVVSPSIRDMS